MPYVDWRMSGPELLNCNCDWGCPCQFNALPTRGDCRGIGAMRIDEGHFGDVSLSGLHWVVLLAWPQAIHLGHGECLPVIDERADEAQRNALATIMSGQETEPGASIFNVFAATFDKVHEPIFRAIQFEADVERRIGRVSVDGVLDTRIEPIRNPVTGDEHRVRVQMPNGFEYKEAEYASGASQAPGPLEMSWASRHAHLAMVDMRTAGVV
jgi:hypothetical protein